MANRRSAPVLSWDCLIFSDVETEFEGGGHAVAVAEQMPEPVPPLPAPVPQEQSAPVAETVAAQAESIADALFTREDLQDALKLIRQMDPVGVACHDLRGCLLEQLHYHQRVKTQQGNANGMIEILADAIAIVSDHLRLIQNKQLREVAKAISRPIEAVDAAMDYVRTLDPRPGLRYNIEEPRLIEPDVAFVKQGDEYLVLLNDDDVPQLRLNTSYKRLMNRDAAEKDVRSYVKERYKSAIQLIKNIEQRKQTILKVCYSIVARQRDFLDHGIDQLKPMMIKEVAEEIGVHPSTVSRAVANKYAHTAQGVFELRYFFSESVQGPEGGNTSLLILKRRVKKLIDEEDPTRPLTDEQITRILQSQGIQVTRRTVAKYREDMKIPSTHQRRVKKS
jgi:RNA polymerase sigma-54 factor